MRYNNRMKKYPLLFVLPIVMAGCFNERGVSLKYYNGCEEYYDMQGYYHKKCDPNLLDYSDLKEGLKPLQNPSHGSVR
jgi:hypothetical protein